LQVKAVEEEYSSQMQQLEAQLEQALLQQQLQQEEAAHHLQQATAAAAAAATAAAQQHHGRRLPLPAIDTSSAAEKVLLLLNKLSQVRCRPPGSPVSICWTAGVREEEGLGMKPSAAGSWPAILAWVGWTRSLRCNMQGSGIRPCLSLERA
jgi:hypothetical protein